MKVLVLTRYGPLGASSRYRFLQYLPLLREQGIETFVSPLLDDLYLERLYAGRGIAPARIVATYLRRLRDLLQSRRYDLVWLEKEALPWLPACCEFGAGLGRVPWVVDYDDATFHRYDAHRLFPVRKLLGGKIDRIMARAQLVVAGNDYIAERAAAAGARRVEIVPTVIDLQRYAQAAFAPDETLSIGWIGTPKTAHYLRAIQPALAALCAAQPVRVVAVGAGDLELEGVPLDLRPWSEATEVGAIQSFTVGIMPLPDEPWERGKSALKLIQYMGCGVPVVGSPVGVNRTLIRHGENGFQANSMEEWKDALSLLLGDRALRQRLGRCGLKIVESGYNLTVTAPRLAQLLKSVGSA